MDDSFTGIRIEQTKVYADVFKTLMEREEELTKTEAGELMEQFVDLTREKPVSEFKKLVIDKRLQKFEVLQIKNKSGEGD